MPIATRTAKASGLRMSDEAVKAKTRKTWKEWFSVLDRAGAKKMTHQEIANYLHTEHAVPPWWTQMVTVTYEQQSGLREKHQRPDGYQISVSRTINVPLTRLYKSVANEKSRSAWLDEKDLEVRRLLLIRRCASLGRENRTLSFISIPRVTLRVRLSCNTARLAMQKMQLS